MKKTIAIIFLFCALLNLNAQDEAKKMKVAKSVTDISLSETLTDEYLDTVQVKKKLKLNDYSMIGVQYGAALSQVMWNPSQKQDMLLMPYTV